MKKILYFVCTASLIIPSLALAAVTDFRSLLQLFADLLGSVIGVLYMVAFVTFFWGIGIFILNTTDDKKRQEGKAWMFWSVIALFVMITIWGLIGVLVNTVGITPLIIPQLPSTP